MQGSTNEQQSPQYCEKDPGNIVHYYSAVGHYALPSEDQKQMLLWAHCCELEGLSWSDQLWYQLWRNSKQVGESQKRATRISCFGDYDELVGLVYLVKER